MANVVKVMETWSEVWQSIAFGLCNVNTSFRREPLFLCAYHGVGFHSPPMEQDWEVDLE